MKYLHRTGEGEKLYSGVNWHNERIGWGVIIVIGRTFIRFRFRKKYNDSVTRRIFFDFVREKDLLKPSDGSFP